MRPISRRVPCEWEQSGCFTCSCSGAVGSNFDVELNKSFGLQNNGTGILTLPDRQVGQKLVKMYRQKALSIEVHGKKIFFHISGKRPMRKKAEILDKTPYLPPDTEEEREKILEKLNERLYVDKLQFGVFYRRADDSTKTSRRFSNEYELSHCDKSAGILYIEYDRKLIRIKVKSYSFQSLEEQGLTHTTVIARGADDR